MSLRGLGYRLQANRKTREGSDHPDRDRQFEHIDETARAAIAAGQPVISVDTKKKELVGTYKAIGREYEPGGRPVEVNSHDFPDRKLGKAVPYGIYDLAGNEAFVSVGDQRRHRRDHALSTLSTEGQRLELAAMMPGARCSARRGPRARGRRGPSASSSNVLV